MYASFLFYVAIVRIPSMQMRDLTRPLLGALGVASCHTKSRVVTRGRSCGADDPRMTCDLLSQYLLVLLNGRTALRGNSLLAAVKCGTDLKNSKLAAEPGIPGSRHALDTRQQTA